jgi:hypothetical protein
MGTREGEEAFFKPDEEGLKQDGGVKSDKDLQPNDDLASERVSSPPPEEVELEEVVVVVAEAIVQPDILLPTVDDAASGNRGDEDALQETKVIFHFVETLFYVPNFGRYYPDLQKGREIALTLKQISLSKSENWKKCCCIL